MTSDYITAALKSKAWPFIEAKKIFKSLNGITPKKGYVLFETGYGPSGLPHIGTFAEVTRTVMVQEAFKRMYNMPTKLICFSDDIDGLRKIPTNVPNQEMIKQHIGKSLTSIPDPFGEKESFGDYMNSKFCSFLDRFEIKYEFYSATKCYKSGLFDHMMVKVIENYDKILQVMLPNLGEERQKTYSPFMPICSNTGQVLQVKIENINRKKNTISYKNIDNELIETSVKGGKCKLQWKPDFAMRWAALNVDYEMYGKDHLISSKIYNKICQILGGKVPTQYFYELFLDEHGHKISKTIGNSIDIDQWLRYAPIDSIKLYTYQSPSKAKRLHFAIIPKTIDEYINYNNNYYQEHDIEKKINNPLFHIHNGNVPKINVFNINFTLLLNLATVCNPENKSILWGFIKNYAPNANQNNSPYLDNLVNFAINYYNDFIKKNKKYLLPSPEQKEYLLQILNILKQLHPQVTSEEIQTHIYSIGKKSNYNNLRIFFQELYQILFGQQQGPRMGSFIKIFGIENSYRLISEKINNS